MPNQVTLSKQGYYTNKASNKSIDAHKAYVNRNNNAQPPVQYHNLHLTMAKCPHGFPGGACPICMGKTGGGGGSDQKRTGMSWGEAYYVWTKLQLIQRNLVTDQKLNEMERQRLKILEKIQASMLYQKLAEINNLIKNYINVLKVNITQVQQTVTRIIFKAATVVINTLNICITKLQGVVAKLTALAGEKLKNIKDFIEKNIKKILAKIAQARILSKFFKIFEDKTMLFQEFLLKKIESLKEKTEKIMKKIIKISEKEEKNKKRKNK